MIKYESILAEKIIKDKMHELVVFFDSPLRHVTLTCIGGGGGGGDVIHY